MRVAPLGDGVMYPSGTARSNVSSRELAVIAQKVARLFSKEKVVSSILTHCSRSAGPNQQMDPRVNLLTSARSLPGGSDHASIV